MVERVVILDGAMPANEELVLVLPLRDYERTLVRPIGRATNRADKRFGDSQAEKRGN